VDSMSRCRHKHLVALVGVCVSDNQCVLVYEYMVNGSLEDHLYAARPDAEKIQGRGAPVFLTWPMRFKIALGTAKGLAYLHEVRLILFRHAISFEKSLSFMDLWRPILMEVGWEEKSFYFSFARCRSHDNFFGFTTFPCNCKSFTFPIGYCFIPSEDRAFREGF
jgi:hypothetical protein